MTDHELSYNPDNTLRDISNIFTVERQKELLRYISRGVSIRNACQMTGLPRKSYYNYKQRGFDIIQAIENDIEVKIDSYTEAIVAFFLNAERAEAAFETRLDTELSRRVDDMEDRDLIRMRELRAGGWGKGTSNRIEITNTGGGTVHITSFSENDIMAADNALLEAGIIEAEVVNEESVDSNNEQGLDS